MLLAFAASVGARASGPFTELLLLRPDGVIVHFQVELAQTPAAREVGLMGRTEMAARSGMWFDFGRNMPVVMWMKDTLLPLDMAFIDAQGTLVGIQARTVPHALDYLSVPQPVRYVLEVNAGELAELGVTAGARAVVPRSD